VVAAVQQRPRSCRPVERQAPTHRGAELHEVERARRLDERHDPALDQLVDVDELDRALELPQRLDLDHRAQPPQGMLASLIVQDAQLGLEVGIAERGAHQEAIQLGFGQRERALLLDRVVRGDEQKRIG
jgi:hypothetical protein